MGREEVGRKVKERDGEGRDGKKREGDGWGEKGRGKIQFQSKINKKQNKKKQQPTSTWDECLIKEESWQQDQMN